MHGGAPGGQLSVLDVSLKARRFTESVIREMTRLPVPVIVTITGEGGSGGALAIAVGDRVLMLENSVYSVISPEGCAAILWRDESKAPEAAEALKLTAASLFDLGVIDEIIPEPSGGAHRAPAETVARVNHHLAQKNPSGRFVTAFYGLLTDTGELRYCNAGHNPPLLVTAGGEVHELEEGMWS